MEFPCRLIFLVLAAVVIAAGPLYAGLINSDEPPVIPVGLDAFRMWDKWAYLRIGQRTYMNSTYDRTGGNRSADASHFLYRLADDLNVTLDIKAQGVLAFARYNHWHGSPWHYIVDGRDYVIQESSTADPLHPVQGSVFIPEKQFPNPLTWTWSHTKGADLMWVPIPFEKSFTMAYGRTRYGTGYYIHHRFMPGANLSRAIKGWTMDDIPSQDVLDLINSSGSDIAPKGDKVTTLSGSINLRPNETKTLASITKAPSTIRALKFNVLRGQADAFSKAWLRIYWDSREIPSVDAPVNLFFGTGSMYNREKREYLVKAFPVNIRFDPVRAHFAVYFPMPLMKSARIDLVETEGTEIKGLRWSIRYEPYTDPANWAAYFHATYADHGDPVPGEDLVFLDTTRVEGGGDWCGHFVGTSFIFSDRAYLGTLEGDPRFFFDDSNTPQAQGTGTEEWGGGGDYWGGRTMTLPFAGHPVGAGSEQKAECEEDMIESAYRFLLSDLMPFGKNARIQFEHGSENQSREHYRSVTYWYGLPGPSLIKTDKFDVGDPESEKAHNYISPDASDPVEITSRYEWGPDSLRISDGGPLAEPDDYAEMEFYADAGITYNIWVRGKNLDGSMTSDASWLQFDEDIGTYHVRPSYRSSFGFGNWLDRYPVNTYAWSSGRPQDPPLTVTFDRAGKHRVRMQPRHGKHYIEQIWLSATQKTQPDFTDARQKESSKDGQTAAISDIVLDSEDLTVLNGRLAVARDEGASAGKVLVVDEPTGREIYPAHTDIGRVTKGESEFTLKLTPGNLGVLLRRKLDYSYPNQCAEVYVASDGDAGWQLAGTWYLAGSNTCLYSDPPGELDPPQRNVITSNRRFRDDEFMIPRRLTEGKSSIRVRVKFVPVAIPLFPGHPLPELGWSEIRYTAYCFVMPKVED